MPAWGYVKIPGQTAARTEFNAAKEISLFSSS
jgi:hypothetical protein